MLHLTLIFEGDRFGRGSVRLVVVDPGLDRLASLTADMNPVKAPADPFPVDHQVERLLVPVGPSLAGFGEEVLRLGGVEKRFQQTPCFRGAGGKIRLTDIPPDQGKHLVDLGAEIGGIRGEG